jgi:hypothetical protein
MRPVLLTASLLLMLSPGLAAGRERKRHPEAAEPPAPPAEQAAKAETRSPAQPPPVLVPKGPTRVDFDDRLLQGQTNRLGAVYLYQRKDPVRPSLLDRHKSFRAEIKRDLLE